jgi:hypothetical protein
MDEKESKPLDKYDVTGLVTEAFIMICGMRLARSRLS